MCPSHGARASSSHGPDRPSRPFSFSATVPATSFPIPADRVLLRAVAKPCTPIFGETITPVTEIDLRQARLRERARCGRGS